MTNGVMPNVHELDEAGLSKVAWCFVPTGQLVAVTIACNEPATKAALFGKRTL